jgi:hypothetical protein
MRYDHETCTFVELAEGDLDEVVGWLERVRKNEYEPEPEWARACIEDGDFIQNESDRRFYTATKLYQQVSLLVIEYLKGRVVSRVDLVCEDCDRPDSEGREVHCICEDCLAGWDDGTPTLEEVQTVLEQVKTYLSVNIVPEARAVIDETLLRFKKA